MSDTLFTIILTVVIVLVISAIVLSILARQAAEKDCNATNESSNYSTYSAIAAGVALILISIAMVLFFFACPTKCPGPPKDDTRELVAKATEALQKHAAELKIHADVLNDAFGKVNNISKDLATTCKGAEKVCPVSDLQQQSRFQFPVAKKWGADSPLIIPTKLPQTNITM
jgi:uncharacterized membrane protein